VINKNGKTAYSVNDPHAAEVNFFTVQMMGEKEKIYFLSGK